jgi:hypothetical protein
MEPINELRLGTPVFYIAANPRRNQIACILMPAGQILLAGLSGTKNDDVTIGWHDEPFEPAQPRNRRDLGFRNRMRVIYGDWRSGGAGARQQFLHCVLRQER